MNGKTVLVVEDEPALLEMIEMYLEMAGFTVTTACNGKEAITLLESGIQFDRLITDYNLPGATGLEVLAKAKQLIPNAQMTLASGQIDGEIAATAKSYGPVEVLFKPDLQRVLAREAGIPEFAAA